MLSMLFPACRDSSTETADPADASDVAVYFRMHLPREEKWLRSASARAVIESEINTINVLIFEDRNNDGTYLYDYAVSGYSLNSLGNSQYEFFARITPSDNPLKIYLLANAATDINVLSSGMTEIQVKQAMNRTFTPAGIDGYLPMFGEAEFMDGLQEDTSRTDMYMVRSIARADVVNSAADFELTSVQVYRASNRYQIIPNSMVDDVVITASIPAGTTQTVDIPAVSVAGNISAGAIYLPESPLPAEENRREATAIVIGGIYGNDDNATFYRLDFTPDFNTDLFGQILRNHRYYFNIDTVMASGWRTPDEAAVYGSTNIGVEVKEWNENTVSMVFDDVNYFGVSSRTIYVAAIDGSQTSVEVDTNLDSYLLYWTDAAGNTLPGTGPITLDKSFTDPDGLFTVNISDDGTRIIVTANERNGTGSPVTRYMRAEAGRLKLSLTIVQETLRLQQRTLNVLGSRGEIGSLGDVVFGGYDAGDRTRFGMVPLMDNKSNFGPNGVVPIEGISRAAQSLSGELPVLFIPLFDVLYFTYAGNPSNTTEYLNWINATDKRVMIVQHDNPSTNRLLLQALIPGVTITEISQEVPFTVYENPPEQIMNGVFGTVDPDMTFRCFDGTHGQIPLQFALDNGISPILLNRNNNMVLGIDFSRNIVYSGDIDLYHIGSNGRQGEYLTGNGLIENNADRLIANLWAWIATVCLTE